jgi:hypothetical protein
MYSLFDDEKKRSLVPQIVFVYGVILLYVILQWKRETGYSINSHVSYCSGNGLGICNYYIFFRSRRGDPPPDFIDEVALEAKYYKYMVYIPFLIYWFTLH